MTRTGRTGFAMRSGGGLRGKVKAFVTQWMWVVETFLAFVGGAALANTVFGDWIGEIAAFCGGIPGWLVSLFGGPAISATLVLTIAVIGMIVVIFLDLLDGTVNKPALTSLVLLFPVALRATGPVAEFALWLMARGQEVGMATLGTLLGG